MCSMPPYEPHKWFVQSSLWTQFLLQWSAIGNQGAPSTWSCTSDCLETQLLHCSCNQLVPTVSAHKALTVAGCRDISMPFQHVRLTERLMFLTTAPPRPLDPGRLWAPHCPMWLPSHFLARLKVSWDCGLFPPLESLDHRCIQELLDECCSLPGTAEKIVSCLSHLLCLCTKSFAAPIQTQNGTHPFSARQQALLEGCWGKINMHPLLPLGPRATTSNHYPPWLQSRLLPCSPSGYITTGRCSLVSPWSPGCHQLRFLAAAVVLVFMFVLCVYTIHTGPQGSSSSCRISSMVSSTMLSQECISYTFFYCLSLA